MSTVAYAHDIGDDVAFASSSGVKRGIVSAVQIRVDGTGVRVSYYLMVRNAKDSAVHAETADESRCAATLDAAWTIYQGLAS